MEITSYTRLTLCPRKTGKELIRIGTSCAGHTMWRRNKGPYKEKSRAPRTASFALSAQHYLLSTYPETTSFPLYWRSGSPNDLCSPTKSNLLPPLPSYFKILLSSLHWFFFFLNCRPIVLLPWNLTFQILTVFTIAPLSSHQAHTCPWLSKAIYLVSEACAMGLFGAQKPDTVLSIAIATAVSQYSSKGPEQVELKSWWLGNDVFCHIDLEPKQTDRI